MRFLFIICFISRIATAQFAPPQGQMGSTAMYKDSSAFVAWVSSCKITRGLQDISNTSSGYATVGDSSSGLNIADGNVVSLGDGGYAVCAFQHEIYDGLGYDFAVFENSFDGNYLEFGFVEVSSDGVNYFRFPATSNTQDTVQTGSFGYSDATKINNLAGKYIAQYGTPFDLDEMQGISGLDVNHITHVKIVDVVGSVNALYATHDKNNNKVNDPWPTAFASCGFDLDAVGVINQQTNNAIQEIKDNSFISVYPNPASNNLCISLNKRVAGNASVYIIDINGKTVFQKEMEASERLLNIDILAFDNGFYFLQLKDNSGCITKKISIAK
ncbi:MAG TPA: T9SS type A sorting domain-containing protein [Bacteroidia bacterium]|nr:T9SS type A sorting domain-containing protein [Bacteroidia bacterium]